LVLQGKRESLLVSWCEGNDEEQALFLDFQANLFWDMAKSKAMTWENIKSKTGWNFSICREHDY
jgi:hypothetical protein